jgi:hypothetical protein
MAHWPLGQFFPQPYLVGSPRSLACGLVVRTRALTLSKKEAFMTAIKTVAILLSLSVSSLLSLPHVRAGELRVGGTHPDFVGGVHPSFTINRNVTEGRNVRMPPAPSGGRVRGAALAAWATRFRDVEQASHCMEAFYPFLWYWD